MKKRTLLISAGLGIGLVVAGVYGVRWWIRAMNTVSTDDARVTASYATISAEVFGSDRQVSSGRGGRGGEGDSASSDRSRKLYGRSGGIPGRTNSSSGPTVTGTYSTQGHGGYGARRDQSRGGDRGHGEEYPEGKRTNGGVGKAHHQKPSVIRWQPH